MVVWQGWLGAPREQQWHHSTSPIAIHPISATLLAASAVHHHTPEIYSTPSIQAVYDHHLLTLYKLYMEEHLHMPYNFYGENVTEEAHALGIGRGFSGWFGRLRNKFVRGDRAFAPSLLVRFSGEPHLDSGPPLGVWSPEFVCCFGRLQEWVLRETLARHADVKEMQIPPATRQCFLDVLVAFDELDLAGDPKCRHNTRSYFELVGAGVDANSTAVIGANRTLTLTIRVRRNRDKRLLWYQCGDLFNVRVATKKHVGADVDNTLPVVSVPAYVVDNFNYTYTVMFTMPRNYPAGLEWQVEVLHEKHRFNHLRPYAGEKAKEENWNEFLNDYIDGSPFPFRFREEGPSQTLPSLPLYRGGFLPGSFVNNIFMPDDARLVRDVTPELFNQCFAERNYCLISWGCSVSANLWEKLRQFLPPHRSRYERLNMLAWRGTRETMSDKLEVFENIRLAMDLGIEYRDGMNMRSVLNCTADPTAQMVHLINSGVHEVAWGEKYPYTSLGIEWLVRQMRELFPDAIVIWNRSAAIHLKRFTAPYTDRENLAQIDYRNCFSNTRLEIFDLLARRTMRANNLTFTDIYGPTIAAPEYTTRGDMRHYAHQQVRFLPDLVYTRLCTGPPPPRIRDVMLPMMPRVKTDPLRLLEQKIPVVSKPPKKQ